MKAVGTLIPDFFGSDPIRGAAALEELVKDNDAEVVKTLIPVESWYGALSSQVEVRLGHLGRALGPEVVPYLAEVIRSGPWHAKILASPCFSFIECRDETSDPLRAILSSGEIDAQRIAIEAMGYLGAVDWGSFIVEFADFGRWIPSSGEMSSSADRYSKYIFEKFSPYVVTALARMAGRASTDRDAQAGFRLLREFSELRSLRLPSHYPDAWTLIRSVSHEFGRTGVDALIANFATSSDERHRDVGLTALGEIAPVRATGLLLTTAANTSLTPAIRTTASIALGELQHLQTAERLAELMRSSATDRAPLDWAFSNLYALDADWTGLSDYATEVSQGDNEPAAQMRLSLAIRGENECRADLVSRLDHQNSFERWTSALCLARLLGRDSIRYLHGRAEEASDPLERCGMYSAMVRAGDQTKASDLHNALQEVTLLPRLRSIWKVEILSSLRDAPTMDPRAVELWRACSHISQQKFSSFERPALKRTADSTANTTPGVQIVPSQVSTRTKQSVFISYSREDKEWLKQLQRLLNPLVRKESVGVWDDTKIQSGKWEAQIGSALSGADVALFLVSDHFLASDFIMRQELPELLHYAEVRGTKILWVLLDYCLWEEIELKDFQCEHDPKIPLSAMPEAEKKQILTQVCRKIASLTS